ncbi:GAF domain-containing protein [Phragmitibacter flavus]|uniref:GAF domain-containing protein n=1 Tax=Phragmitibacter flavus TaxID=2576071 RepID=A0A5R8KJP1_9BACT|nr:GAF domain-containing protein [Phragmitibacter flavus]TLD72536.1 GAF domain-containing protein [Phragmitibacter flavus]
MFPTLPDLLSHEPVDWQAVLDATIEDFDCTTGTLHRLHADTQMLHLVAQRGIPEQIMPMVLVIPVGKGIAGVAAETRQPVELCNLQKDLGGVAKDAARKTNVQGSLAVPVQEGPDLCGTLGIGKMTPHDFTAAEKDRLMSIATEMAPYLALD